MKHKHDLEYIGELIDSLENTQDLLQYLYHQKVSQCPFYSYDDEAFETNCNHPKILREIHEEKDCRHCPFFLVEREES